MERPAADLTLTRSASLDELIATLRSLIEHAESGQWESLPTFEHRIPSLLEALKEKAGPLSGERLREALALHQKALSLCKDRMTCLEPLIKAFDENAPRTGT